MKPYKEIIQLEPLIPPETVSFWPPQPGWYVLAIILLIASAYGVYRIIKYKKRNAYRKLALKELENLSSQNVTPTAVVGLNRLLKLTALSGYPRKEVADLTGEPWLEFLDKTCKRKGFKQTPAQVLSEISYRPVDQIELSQKDWSDLILLSAVWIKKHKVMKN